MAAEVRAGAAKTLRGGSDDGPGARAGRRPRDADGSRTRTVPESLREEHGPAARRELLTCALPEGRRAVSRATSAADGSSRPPQRHTW